MIRRLALTLLVVGCADGTPIKTTTQRPRGARDLAVAPPIWDAAVADAEAADVADGGPPDGEGDPQPDAREPAPGADAGGPDAAELAADLGAPADAGVDPDAWARDAELPLGRVDPDAAPELDALPEVDLAVADPDAAPPEPDAAPPEPDVPSAPGQLVINEVDYDQPGTDDAEFVELCNLGGEAVSLAGYALEFVNGSNGVIYDAVVLDPGELAPGELLVLGPPAVLDALPATVAGQLFEGQIQNGAPDGLRLLDPDGAQIDGLAYEGRIDGVGEGSPPEDSDPGEGSLTRCDGAPDRDDNRADFVLRPITPGAVDGCE